MQKKELVGVGSLSLFFIVLKNRFIMVNYKFYKKDNSKEKLKY